MPARSFGDGAGTLRRSLFPALLWGLTCALARPVPTFAAAPADTLPRVGATRPEPRGPLTLGQALRLSLAHNLAITERAWFERAEAARARDEARAPNPTLEAAVENFGGDLGTSQEERTLSLGQSFDLGGRRRALGSLADALEKRGAAAVEAQRREVARQAAESFLEAWRLEKRVRLLSRAESIGQAAIAAARERTRIGAAPVTEALRAEGEWAQRGIERRQAEADLAVARRQLALLWGSQTASFDSLVLAEPESDSMGTRPPGSIAAHPEVRQAVSESAVASARLRAAKASRFPELTAVGGVRQFTEGRETGYIATLSAPIPLWNRSQSLIAAAEADRQAAAAHEVTVRLQLQQQIAEAEARKTAARDAWDLARNRAEPATLQALAQLESGYRRGRFTYLELLDARRSALDIQFALVDAERDYWRAVLDLRRLNGEPMVDETEVNR